MKRMINTAITYGILALLSGVVFREVTRFANFKEDTTLSLIHTHLFAMGMLVFLILLSLEKQFSLTKHARYSLFYWLYNIGLTTAVLGFLIRGMIQVYHIEVASGLNASISGVVGIGHTLFATGIVLVLFIIKQSITENK